MSDTTAKTCGFCGHPAIGYSASERTHVCERCADGYHAGDVHGELGTNSIEDVEAI